MNINKMKQAQTIEFRIKKLEVNKEETESEIHEIELTIQSVKELADTRKGIAREELKGFLNKLETEKEQNKNIKDEIQNSIEYVRNN